MLRADLPGIGRVVGSLTHHWAALDADFARFYRLSLAESCWGPDAIGIARLERLIAYLPPDAAYLTARGQAWTTQDELAALQVELLHALLVTVARLGGSKRRIAPLRIPRPGEPTRAPGRRTSWLTLIGEEVAGDSQAG